MLADENRDKVLPQSLYGAPYGTPGRSEGKELL